MNHPNEFFWDIDQVLKVGHFTDPTGAPVSLVQVRLHTGRLRGWNAVHEMMRNSHPRTFFSCFWMIFVKFEETIWKLKLLQASSDSCTPALWGTSFDWQLVCKSSFALIFVTFFGSKVIAPMEVVQKHGVAVFSCTLTTLAWTQRSVTLVSMQDSGSVENWDDD